MKYLDEFRNADIAKKLADDLHRITITSETEDAS